MGGRILPPFVCVSVYFPRNISETDAALTRKLGIEMFHDDSCKSFILGSVGQGDESQKHCRRGCLHSCECWLLVTVEYGRRLFVKGASHGSVNLHNTFWILTVTEHSWSSWMIKSCTCNNGKGSMAKRNLGGVCVYLSVANETRVDITVCTAWPLRRQTYGLRSQPETTTVPWPVLISRPTEDRRPSWPSYDWSSQYHLSIPHV